MSKIPTHHMQATASCQSALALGASFLAILWFTSRNSYLSRHTYFSGVNPVNPQLLSAFVVFFSAIL